MTKFVVPRRIILFLLIRHSFWMRTICRLLSFDRTYFFFSSSQCRSEIVVEPTISHTTMRFRRIRRPSGLGRQLKFRFSRPCSRADELAAVVGPPIPLLLNTSRLYIPVQTRPKIFKYVANMPRRMARRPEFIEKVVRPVNSFSRMLRHNSQCVAPSTGQIPLSIAIRIFLSPPLPLFFSRKSTAHGFATILNLI